METKRFNIVITVILAVVGIANSCWYYWSKTESPIVLYIVMGVSGIGGIISLLEVMNKSVIDDYNPLNYWIGLGIISGIIMFISLISTCIYPLSNEISLAICRTFFPFVFTMGGAIIAMMWRQICNDPIAWKFVLTPRTSRRNSYWTFLIFQRILTIFNNKL